MSIAVNFLTGPAMLQIPSLFQKSGLIPTTLCIICTCFFTTVGCLHFANAISKLPGNRNYSNEVEYSDAFQKYWPNNPRWVAATQIVFFLCVTCLNVSSLVDSAQVFDVMLANCGFLGGRSHALRITTSETAGLDWVYESWDLNLCDSDEDCVPFSDHEDEGGVLLTAGYIINALFFMPLALMDLQENAVWQILEFLVLIVTSTIFSFLFISNGIEFEGRLSWWGDSWDSLLGVVLFNFALVISIPAWLFEKEPSVDATKVITGSSIMAALLYILLGTLGAMSKPNVSDNMLQSFMSGGQGITMQITSFFFAIFIVGLGIPLLSVLGRLNLTGSGYSDLAGDIFAVYIPFGFSWLFYRGHMITELLTWGGILFTSLVAFLFPIFLAMRALDVSDNPGSIFGNYKIQHMKFTLHCLLAVAIISILASIVGNLT
ncbi:hypothetical protein FRACYDRAFT_223599 [Fragilariopsis cylindrus CCMP1102]|uniref:Amino acid transporter transmembrane domain-containing protein n=1 Tax=Fragilariopsis cylindrus CCMP1102 TaxID=635003 RepID=A0A1E7FY59_9STRA|nr:hypothetical protein FRACYDRAFT_223599 [Fragilariopsis cylindrus CCMP1102]|eukprot:OEU22753.1 hypothetical protein FRACYDRAFT_223599 [Fragilariopsis cylindrus CCMP1102]